MHHLRKTILCKTKTFAGQWFNRAGVWHLERNGDKQLTDLVRDMKIRVSPSNKLHVFITPMRENL